MHDIGVDTDSGYEYLYKGDFSESSGYDSILYMIGHYSVQPTTIISANNTMCIGILKALYAQGLQVPEQYSVACFNGLENMELYRVQPTVADYSPSLFGQVAGRHDLTISLRKLPEQVLKKVIPVNVIHISDQMPGGIKAVVMVVFRNRTGHQVIILKITIKKPCHCGNIPDHA